MIHRRDFLVGAGTTMLAGGLSKRAANAGETPWAVSFDSSSYAQNLGGIPEMPTAFDPIGMVVFKFRQNAGFVIGDWKVYGTCQWYHRAVTITVSSGGLDVALWGALPQTCMGQNAVIGTVSKSMGDTWHDVICSWNGNAGIIKVMIDGQAQNVNMTNYNGYGVATDFRKICRVGILSNATGDMADVGLWAGGSFIEPASVTDRLYNSSTGYSVRNADCGDGIVDDRSPQIWLSGPKSIFRLNGAARIWHQNSDTSDPETTTSAFQWIGNITTATSDPFQPGSPT